MRLYDFERSGNCWKVRLLRSPTPWEPWIDGSRASTLHKCPDKQLGAGDFAGASLVLTLLRHALDAGAQPEVPQAA
jgi:hypothetical protein